MGTFYSKSFSYAFFILLCIGFFAVATHVFAQTELPQGVTQEQIDAALADISAVYGSPVVRADQAKAICNQEQYFFACAEIGKKHGLFDTERIKQVNTLVNQLRGDVIVKLTQCTDVDCLVGVASSLARKLNKENPTVANAVGLTPQKVEEKRNIVEAAKSAGVDFEECRTMDPETASIELLRACAKLAKDERVQKYIPESAREHTDKTEATIALKENLANGQLQCGDGTLNGCGNFCLNPSAEARAQGTSAIPAVCREKAQRFFGTKGGAQLEASYTQVQQTREATLRNQEAVFTTIDGETLTSP